MEDPKPVYKNGVLIGYTYDGSTMVAVKSGAKEVFQNNKLIGVTYDGESMEPISESLNGTSVKKKEVSQDFGSVVGKVSPNGTEAGNGAGLSEELPKQPIETPKRKNTVPIFVKDKANNTLWEYTPDNKEKPLKFAAVLTKSGGFNELSPLNQDGLPERKEFNSIEEANKFLGIHNGTTHGNGVPTSEPGKGVTETLLEGYKKNGTVPTADPAPANGFGSSFGVLPQQDKRTSFEKISEIAKSQEEQGRSLEATINPSLAQAIGTPSTQDPFIKNQLNSTAVLNGDPDAVINVIKAEQNALQIERDKIVSRKQKEAFTEPEQVSPPKDYEAIRADNEMLTQLYNKKQNVTDLGLAALNKLYADKWDGSDQTNETGKLLGEELRKKQSELQASTYTDEKGIVSEYGGKKISSIASPFLREGMAHSGITGVVNADEINKEVVKVGQEFDFNNEATLLNAVALDKKEQLTKLSDNPAVQQKLNAYINGTEEQKAAMANDPDVKGGLAIANEYNEAQNHLTSLLDKYPEVKHDVMTQKVSESFGQFFIKAKRGDYGAIPAMIEGRSLYSGNKLDDEFEIKKVAELSGLSEDEVRLYAADAKVPSYLGIAARSFGDVFKSSIQGLNRLTGSDASANIENRLIENTKYHEPEAIRKQGWNADKILSTMFSTTGAVAAYGLEGWVGGEVVGGLTGLTRLGRLATADMKALNVGEQILPGADLGKMMVKLGVADTPEAGLANIVQTANRAKHIAGTYSSMYVTSYEGAYKEAAQFTNDEDKRREYAGQMANANGIAMVILNPANLVGKILKKIPNETVVQNFLKTEVGFGTKDVVKARLAEISKTAALGVVQVTIPQLQAVISKENIFDYHTSAATFFKEAGENALNMAVGILPLAVLGAAKVPSSEFLKSSIYEVGMKPDLVKSNIEMAFTKGEISEAERNRQISVINTLSGLVSTTPETNLNGMEFSQPQKNEIVYRSLQNAGLRDKMANPKVSPELKSQYEKEIKINTEVVDKLFGEIPEVKAPPAATSLTPEETTAIDGIKSKDLSGTGLEAQWNVIKDEAAPAEQKKAALKEISDQLLAPSTAEQIGTLLGKDVSVSVENLGHEAPKESDNLKAAQAPEQGTGVLPEKKADTVGEVGNSVGGDKSALGDVVKPLNELEKMPYDKRTDAEHSSFIKQKFVKEFTDKGVPKEQADAAVALLEARAKIANPDNPDAYFRNIQDIGNGEFQEGSDVKNQGEWKKIIIAATMALQPLKAPKAPVRATDGKTISASSSTTKEKEAITKFVNDYYSVNGETASQDKIDRAIELWEIYGRPSILPDSTGKNERAYANSEVDSTGAQKIILGNITNFDDFIAEISHAAQYHSGAELSQGKYKTTLDYDKQEYNRKGSIEYDAHKLIEPYLANYVLTGKKGTDLVLGTANAIGIDKLSELEPILKKYNVRFQGDRGAVETLASGRTIIHALDAPDLWTAVHEIHHIFEGEISDTERETFAKWSDTKVGSTEYHEAFADAGVTYLNEGKAPTKELQPLFERFKTWLTELFKGLKGTPAETKLSPEVRAIYDKLLGKEAEAPTMADNLQKAREQAPPVDNMSNLESVKSADESARINAERLRQQDPLVKQEAELDAAKQEAVVEASKPVIEDVLPEIKVSDKVFKDFENKKNELRLKREADAANQKANQPDQQSNEQAPPPGPDQAATNEAIPASTGTAEVPPLVPEPVVPSESQPAEEWTSVRNEKLKEIEVAKKLFEKHQETPWTDSFYNALKNVQAEFPGKSLYDAMKLKLDQLTASLNANKGKLPSLNPTEDTALLKVLRAETDRKISEIEGWDSNDDITREIALKQWKSLQADLFDIASVSKGIGSEAGRALNIRQAEINNDNGLKIRRMEMMEANGGGKLSDDMMDWTAEHWAKEKELLMKEQELREKGMQEKFDKEMENLHKQYEAKLKEAKTGKKETNKDKLLSQKGEEFAARIRRGKLGKEAFGTFPGVPQAINFVIEAIAQIVEKGATLAEAIQQFVAEHKVSDKDKFEKDFFDILGRREKGNDALDKIKEIVLENKTGSITADMVAKNLVRDYVEAHIGEVEPKDVLDTALAELKEIMPDLTKESLREAYLKEGDYKLQTKEKLVTDFEQSKRTLQKLEKIEKDLADLRSKNEVYKRAGNESKVDRVNESIALKEKELQKALSELGQKIGREDKHTKASFETVSQLHNDRIDAITNDINNKLSGSDLTAEQRSKLLSLKDKIESAKILLNDKSALSQKNNVEYGQAVLKTVMGELGKEKDPALQDYKRQVQRSIDRFDRDKAETEQEAKFQRAKERLRTDNAERQRKISAGEFEDKKNPPLTKSDAELVNLRIERDRLESLFNYERRKLEDKNKSRLRKAFEFTRAAYVTALIWKLGTLAKVAATSIIRPNVEAANKIIFGNLFRFISPDIAERAKAGGESTSLLTIKKMYEAYFSQVGDKGLEKRYENANAKYEKSNNEYEAYKKSNNPDAEKLKSLKSRADADLVSSIGNFMYKYIGGSSLKDAAGALMHRSNLIEREFGFLDKESIKEGNALDKIKYVMEFIGRSHSAVKTFSGRASFAAGFIARLEAAQKDGVDISNSDRILEIANESYIDWDRGKYQQRNFVSDAWNRITTNLDNEWKDGKWAKYGRTAAAVLKFDLPITRVPVNILHEAVVEYTAGAFKALYHVDRAYRDARKEAHSEGLLIGSPEFKAAVREHISNLDADKAAMIVRCFRKGGFGLGLFGLFALSGVVGYGGFHHRNDRKKGTGLNSGELEFGDTKLPTFKIPIMGDIDISKIVEHSPSLFPVLLGLNTKKIYKEKIKKGSMVHAAAIDAVMADLIYMQDQAPQLRLFAPVGTTEAVIKSFEKQTGIIPSKH